MSEDKGKRNFVKYAVGGGIGAAAIAIGAGAIASQGGAPAPTTTTTTAPASVGTTTSSSGTKAGYGSVGEPVDIGIGYLPYAADIITADLIKKGNLWQKYFPSGSHIEWRRFLGGTAVTNNMLADKVQIGYMGDAPSYRCMDILDSKVICLGAYEEGLIGTSAMKKFGEPASFLQSIVVRPDVADKYPDVASLEGSTIGVPIGSIGHKQSMAVEQDGWELDGVDAAISAAPSGDRIYYPSHDKTVGGLIELTGSQPGVKFGQILDIGTELQMAQLRAGTIELVCTWEPYISWMEYKGIGKRLITSTDTLCQCRTGTHFHVASPILARNDFIEQRPDIIDGFLNAEEDAKEMMSKDPDNAAAILHADIPEVPLEILQKDLRMMVYDGRLHPEMVAHHEKSAQLWQDIGIYRGERTGWSPQESARYAYDGQFMDRVVDARKKEGKWTSEDLGILRNW